VWSEDADVLVVVKGGQLWVTKCEVTAAYTCPITLDLDTLCNPVNDIWKPISSDSLNLRLPTTLCPWILRDYTNSVLLLLLSIAITNWMSSDIFTVSGRTCYAS